MKEPDRRAVSPVGVAYSAECDRHYVPGHPERPERRGAIVERVEGEGLLRLVRSLAVRRAREEELLLVHSPALVERIKGVCASGGGWLTRDTAVCAESQEAALWGAGCVLSTVEAVLRGEVKYGFALCRPPGHHANRDQARGYCLYNNVALAAAHACSTFGVERIAIVDWDLHHGNGTQEIFYGTSQVSFLSLHVYGHPFYPGTGRLEEMGEGEGLGHNVNVPLPAGCGDEDYEYVFDRLVRPVLSAWRPRLLLISAGFDAHGRDPFGGMRLTGAGFYRLAKMARANAEEAGIGLVLVLEGGYDLDSLGESVAECVRALLDPGSGRHVSSNVGACPEVMTVVKRAREAFDRNWKAQVEPRIAPSR